jgi:hypothetical protein
MYSRSDLKAMGQAYSDAVKEREIELFTRYIADGVVTYAKKGVTSIRFPLLEKKANIAHGFDGLLNKHDPGPIPITYRLNSKRRALSLTEVPLSFVSKKQNLMVYVRYHLSSSGAISRY